MEQRFAQGIVESYDNLTREMFKQNISCMVVPSGDISKARERGLAISEKVKPLGFSDKDILMTEHVADCNALVLFGERLWGLAHEYPNFNPKDYIDALMERLLETENPNSIKAIQVAGDDNHFYKAREVLDFYGVEVVASYQDHWNKGDNPSYGEPVKRAKYLLISPLERQVVLSKLWQEPFSHKEVVLYEE